MNLRKKMVLVAIPKAPFYGPPNRFDYFQDAVRQLGLQKNAFTNISSCVLGRIPSAYGFVWEDWTCEGVE